MDKQSYLATVEADKSVGVASKFNGYIKALHVSESQRVHKGDLLVQIDATEATESLKSLQTSLNAAQKDLEYKSSVYERNKKLYDIKGLSKEQLDQSGVALFSAKANLQTLKQNSNSTNNQLAYLNIRAPFDGTVSQIFLHEGDLASPSRPILQLNSLDKKMTLSFTGNRVKKGLHVRLNDNEIGEISTIYDDAKNGLKVAEVKLSKELNSTNGENITVDLLGEKMSGCVVQSDALLYDGEQTKIVVYENNRFHFVEVKVLQSQKKESIITPCVSQKIAVASQSKLSLLPEQEDVKIENNETAK